MKTPLIRIGKSYGVCIPEEIIEECGFGNEVDMTVVGQTVVVSSIRVVREGWDEAFRVARFVVKSTEH